MTANESRPEAAIEDLVGGPVPTHNSPTPGAFQHDATTRFVDALRNHGAKIKGDGRDRWRATCPAHNGQDFNLSVAKGDQGVLVKCWSHDCSETNIASSVGLTLRDLFDRDGRATYQYGGGYDIVRERRPSAKGSDKIVKPVRAGITPEIRPLWTPAGTPGIANSPTVFLCEGEKTADALIRLGAPCAATWAGGAQSAGRVNLTPLAGKTVVIVPDNDAPGIKAADTLTANLAGVAESVRRWLVPAHLNDAADLWLEGGSMDDLTPSATGAAAVAGDTFVSPASYVDVAAVLDGTIEQPETTVGGRRSDGVPLLYAAAVNVLLGAPEAGKTLVAGAMAADELAAGGRVLWIDLDHNGAGPLLHRFRSFGVTGDVLRDRSRFRLAIPEDAESLLEVVTDDWGATVAVVDSIGELLPMFGANSNSADEFTAVNRQVMAALAIRGAGVLAIDHEAKSTESAQYGAGGTMAKKRAVDGALLRVVNTVPFRPGHGGSARLSIVKDRHGHLRSLADSEREPLIADFSIEARGDAMLSRFTVPAQKPTMAEVLEDDLALVLLMDPPPTGYRKIKERFGWRDTRAQAAMKAFKERTPGAPHRTPDAGTGHRTPAPHPLRGGAGAGAGALTELAGVQS